VHAFELDPQHLLHTIQQIVWPGTVGLHANRVNACVGPTPRGQVFENLHHIGLLLIIDDRVRAIVLLGQAQAIRDPIDGDDALGTQKLVASAAGQTGLH
jgi:hypothetical protein